MAKTLIACAKLRKSDGDRMSIQRLSTGDFATLENPGFRSVQIVWPNNAPEALVTITRVTMEPGSISARHSHPNSEQIWIVERGCATLLMDHDQTDKMQAGDVVRTPAGSIHGVNNTGREPFVYLTVTTPPQNFAPAYRGPQNSN
jgi:quercetin dioxygenase-like cupin family protein